MGKMRNIVVANIGLQDVWLNVSSGPEPHYVPFDPRKGAEEVRQFFGLARDDGARVMAIHVKEHRQELRDRILLPILEPAIDTIQKKVHSIDRILLLGTDQSPEQQEFYRNDTVNSAELICEILPERFPSHLIKPEVVPCRANPSHQEKADSFMRHTLRTHIPGKQDVRVFASVSGGVPALNASLRQHTANIYGGRGFLVETEPPSVPAGSRAGHLGTSRIVNTWTMRQDMIIRLVGLALRSKNYRGALQILADEGINDEFIIGALKHGQHRQNLDFRAAAAALQNLPDPARRWAASARQAEEDSVQCVAEIAQTAASCLRNEDYIGFLVRLSTFVETARRTACEFLIEMRIGGSKTITETMLTKANPEVVQGLKKKLGRPPWVVTPGLYQTLLEISSTVVGQQGVASRFQELMDKLRSMIDKRNTVVHELKSVSNEDLRKACHGRIKLEQIPKVLDELMNLLCTICQNDSVTVDLDVFKNIEKEVAERLPHVAPPAEVL